VRKLRRQQDFRRWRLETTWAKTSRHIRQLPALLTVQECPTFFYNRTDSSAGSGGTGKSGAAFPLKQPLEC
jgi:hypothetical protein